MKAEQNGPGAKPTVGPGRMNFRRASKQAAYGGRRRRALFAAIFFPLLLLLSTIGSIRLQGWTLDNALTLAAFGGIYISLIMFLISPVRFWWAFRVVLGIVALACIGWLIREVVALYAGALVAPPFALALLVLVGALSLYGVFRPPPDAREEEKYVTTGSPSQPVSWWLAGLVYALLAVPLLYYLWTLYVMFS